MLENIIIAYVSGYLLGALLGGNIAEVIKDFMKCL